MSQTLKFFTHEGLHKECVSFMNSVLSLYDVTNVEFEINMTGVFRIVLHVTTARVEALARIHREYCYDPGSNKTPEELEAVATGLMLVVRYLRERGHERLADQYANELATLQRVIQRLIDRAASPA